MMDSVGVSRGHAATTAERLQSVASCLHTFTQSPNPWMAVPVEAVLSKACERFDRLYSLPGRCTDPPSGRLS